MPATAPSSRELHSLIPGSRLVELDSKNHILRTDEPAFERLMHEVTQFLATDNAPGPAVDTDNPARAAQRQLR